MNEALDDISQIPFEIFWMKYLELGGINFWKTRSNAVWWSLNERQREKAFTELSKEKVKNLCYELLKQYYETS